MAVALSIFGIAFAALCVWLTVRIVNRREKWAKRTAKWFALALIAASILYPISVGPACWVASYTGRASIERQAVAVVYYPLIDCSIFGPPPLANALKWWMHLCSGCEWAWFNDTPGRFDFISD